MNQVLKDTNIAQVSVKNSPTDHEVISLFQFLKKGVTERTQLVVEKRVEFINFKGEKIPTLVALKAITELIKKLREEGTLVSNLAV